MRIVKTAASIALVVLIASGCSHIERVSVSTGGGQFIRLSETPSVSHDGRIMVFSTQQSLDLDDTTVNWDIAVRDVTTGQTVRVSQSFSGGQTNGDSREPTVSGNGRYVAWSSTATDILPTDTDNEFDVYVTDLVTGTTTLESISTAGTKGNGESWLPDLSDDGRYLVFQSNATNLSPSTGPLTDVFLRDRVAGTTQRISLSTAGVGSGPSLNPSISGDGSTVAFQSGDGTLVPGDTNNTADVFRWRAGVTERISLTSTGGQSPASSGEPDVDQDGDVIVFRSGGQLVPADVTSPVTPKVYLWDSGSIELVSFGSGGGAVWGSDPTVDGKGQYVSYRTIDPTISPYGQVVVRDRAAGSLSVLSSDLLGRPGNGDSKDPAFSGDGRVVVFSSTSSNLVGADLGSGPDDTNGVRDIFFKVYPQPAPVLAQPENVDPGSLVAMTLTGSNFRPGAVVGAVDAPGIEIRNVEVLDEQTIKMDLGVEHGTPAGPVTLSVKNVSYGLGATGFCEDCFTVFG